MERLQRPLFDPFPPLPTPHFSRPSGRPGRTSGRTGQRTAGRGRTGHKTYLRQTESGIPRLFRAGLVSGGDSQTPATELKTFAGRWAAFRPPICTSRPGSDRAAACKCGAGRERRARRPCTRSADCTHHLKLRHQPAQPSGRTVWKKLTLSTRHFLDSPAQLHVLRPD